MIAQGDHERAASILREGLREAWTNRLTALVAEFLLAMASLASGEGASERSAYLYASAEAFCRKQGGTLPGWWSDMCRNSESAPRIERSRSIHPDIWASAQTLVPGEIIAMALGEKHI
jgi:hypothetical protein